MWKKLVSIAALFSSAASLSACETTAGKPAECLPRFEMAGRCAKVPQSVKDQSRTKLAPVQPAKSKFRPKAQAAAQSASPIHLFVPQKMNVYGQPL